jgi:dGTPase
MLAQYACDPANTRGRLYKEGPTPYRNEFERDRDRIIHSNAFRRLQGKTQVFINDANDHYRNRLTHSIEVSSVARCIARTLNLSSDLAETIAMAHDLGHSPFGHAGERALNECMLDYGGFSHNTHSLKILTKLERKYLAYDGLNLTWEVLEGIVKHNGPLEKDNIDIYVSEYNSINDLDLNNYSSAEAQIASLSDDITYICHDLEDSIKYQIINFNDLSEIRYIEEYVKDLKDKFKNISASRLIYEVTRKIIHNLIDSLLLETRYNISRYGIETTEDIRKLDSQLVDFTEITKARIAEVKNFLFDKVYRHPHIISITLKSHAIIKGLFERYMDEVSLLPTTWLELIDDMQNTQSIAKVVSDYIACMTDRFAIKEYQAFYNLNFNNI